MKLRHSILMALFAVGTLAIAQGPEDVADKPGDGGTRGTVTEIGAMTLPNVTVDPDAFPDGPVTIGAIQSAFPGTAVASITAATRAATGNYDFQTADGKALAALDLAGTIGIVSTPNAFQEADSITIDLNTPGTQFGFGVGDWAGPFNVNVFSGASLIGSVQVDTTSAATIHFIESTSAFDSVELTANPDNTAANWVITSITTERAVLVPTLSRTVLIVFVAILAFAAVYVTRRRRQA